MNLIHPEDSIKELEQRKKDLKRWVEHLTKGENWCKIAETCHELMMVESELRVWRKVGGK